MRERWAGTKGASSASRKVGEEELHPGELRWIDLAGHGSLDIERMTPGEGRWFAFVGDLQLERQRVFLVGLKVAPDGEMKGLHRSSGPRGMEGAAVGVRPRLIIGDNLALPVAPVPVRLDPSKDERVDPRGKGSSSYPQEAGKGRPPGNHGGRRLELKPQPLRSEALSHLFRKAHGDDGRRTVPGSPPRGQRCHSATARGLAISLDRPLSRKQAAEKRDRRRRPCWKSHLHESVRGLSPEVAGL